jgi:hypothetical protein
MLANVLVHMKTFAFFLLPVIYVLFTVCNRKSFFFFRACPNIALSVVYFLYYAYVIGLLGLLFVFSVHVFITDYLCFAYNTSQFVPTECRFTRIKFIAITG